MTWLDTSKPIIALAPMADYTDQPFCRLCREVESQKCKVESDRHFIIFREMVSAEAIVRESEKTLKMCEFEEIERPVVLQLFGSEPERIQKAAQIVVEKYKPDGIDINMGCPVPKVAGKANSGAALMKDHNRAVEIVSALKNANLGVPVSVKTRLGWSKDDEILEFAQKLEQAGADALSIHGRTKLQRYSGKANWEMIGKAKERVSIPVLANGDIASHEDIKRCLEITGADGVMIGRGALGNPWILQHNTKTAQHKNTLEEISRIILRHAELQVEYYGEKGIVKLRKVLPWYFKNIASMKEIKSKLVRVNSLKELKNIL